ncbi:MAG: SMC-Scp complex subunit ScpB [Limnochordia bacterium]|jgi:segregation and condensation protein B|nr:SMC-Scp complex subunit ScpB [Limnochordia bacterium]
MTDRLKGALEAILFASMAPVSLDTLARLLSIEPVEVEELVLDLERSLASSQRGVALFRHAGGYQLRTKAEYEEILLELGRQAETRLSDAAIETLSIIAYKQPITRAEIEDIRGVRADSAIKTLMERGLIEEVGRKKTIGRPLMYGTTLLFLESFGLDSLESLPQVE